MELVFAIVAALVAFFSFKIYKISEEEDSKFFGISFSLISLSYTVWATMNLFLLSKISAEIFEFELNNILSITYISALVQMGLFVIGLVTLTYSTLPKRTGGTYYLLAGLSLLAIVSSSLPLITFRIVSVLLLSFLLYHYMVEHKSKKARLTLVAFALLLVSSIDFIFTIRYSLAYVIGHLLELVAYSLILTRLVSSVKKK